MLYVIFVRVKVNVGEGFFFLDIKIIFWGNYFYKVVM